MKAFNSFIAILLLLAIALPCSAFVNSVTTPDTPDVCTAFTLTVNGDLPGTNYAINSVSQSITGNTITLDVFIVNQGIGIPVLVPYFVNFNYSGLDAGTYNIVANDYLDGSLSSTINSSITITGFTSAFTSNITNTTAKLNWSEISCACEYLLKGRLAGSPNYLYVPLAGSSTTSFNVSGLTPGATYEWQVLTNCPASGADTMRAKTPIISFATLNCVAPNPVSTTNITATSATVNWTATAGAVGYEVWGRAIGGPIVKLGIAGGATASFTVNNLPSGTTFEWAARTKCSNAPNVFSGFSAVQTFSTSSNETAKYNEVSKYVEGVSVYPNPVNESATLTIPYTENPFSLIVTDLSGNVVQSAGKIGSTSYQIDRKNLSSGIYIYQLYNENQFFNGKFVVQ